MVRTFGAAEDCSSLMAEAPADLHISTGVTHHVCQGNVQEHPSSNGKDHARGNGASDHDPQHQADVAGHRRQQVEEDGLWDAHAGVQQDHEVSCGWSKSGFM